MAYKERVPVCGAILISQYWDKVSTIPPLQPRSKVLLTRRDIVAGTAGQRLAEGRKLELPARQDQQGGD